MLFQKASKPLADIYKTALLQTEKLGVSSHKVKLLLADITNSSIPALFIDNDKCLTFEQENRFNQYLQRLLKQEPIQYIIGKADFYGLILQVNENVLIPRPETEGLVEWISQQNRGAIDILDIGTGSGAIALALKHLNSDYNVFATDISFEAIKLARANARHSGIQVSFYQADLYPPPSAKYDIIVSNPPYISTVDYDSLDDEVKLYEPRLALLAGRDGLDVYRRILITAKKYLNSNGKLYFEIGDKQATAISEIACNNGYQNIELKQDLTGRDRYLCILM